MRLPEIHFTLRRFWGLLAVFWSVQLVLACHALLTRRPDAYAGQHASAASLSAGSLCLALSGVVTHLRVRWALLALSFAALLAPVMTWGAQISARGCADVGAAVRPANESLQQTGGFRMAGYARDGCNPPAAELGRYAAASIAVHPKAGASIFREPVSLRRGPE